MATNASAFFTRLQKGEIRQAIMNAELDSSGEIRVHIESTCPGEVLDRAAVIFKKLKMHNTQKRNGVLIYLAVQNRKFAIIGDTEINKVVTDNFWEMTKNRMLDHFREDRFTEGILEAISEIGHYLKKFFPHGANDKNELPDDISFN